MNDFVLTRITVIKRNGRQPELFNEHKLLDKLRTMAMYLDIHIDPVGIVQRLRRNIIDTKGEITTTDISKRLALLAMACQEEHPDFAVLAQHMEMRNLHKSTSGSFAEVMERLYNYQDPNTRVHSPLISERLFEIAQHHKVLIDNQLLYQNDNKYNYLALRILQESYLLKIDGEVVERPQHMLMRVALAVWPDSLQNAFEAYNSLSNHFFVPSHLMLKHAGSKNQQYLTSVALTLTPDQAGVLDCLNQCILFASKPADVSIDITRWVPENRAVPKTTKFSKGVSALTQVFKREHDTIPRDLPPGPVSFYLEIWHNDIIEFINLNTDQNSSYFSYNVVVPDIFMKRLYLDKPWSLMCPSECGELVGLNGKNFKFLYKQYENTGRYVKRVNSSDLWRAIINNQKATGHPSIIFKDNITEPSNASSNKYTNFALLSSTEPAVGAHSAYLILPAFCYKKLNSDSLFDYHALKKQVKILTKFMDKVIDESDYETLGLKKFNRQNRPLSIGVHGLADLFQKLQLVYTGLEAQQTNKNIFQIICFYALKTSCALSKEQSGPNYRPVTNSHQNILCLHIDQWNFSQQPIDKWQSLREHIQDWGLRNTALVSLKRDRITAEIMGVSNSLDPNISNISKVDLFGHELMIANDRLLRIIVGKENRVDIERQFRNHPDCALNLLLGAKYCYRFKTAAEILPIEYVRMARDRAPFVDQLQATKFYIKSKIYFDKFDRNQKEAWISDLKTIYKIVTPSEVYQVKRFTRDINLVRRESLKDIDMDELFSDLRRDSPVPADHVDSCERVVCM